jgi:hypothetical protein
VLLFFFLKHRITATVIYKQHYPLIDYLKAQKNVVLFIAALFTIAKLWKQPRCPTADEWLKKMWYLYTMEFYSAMKKNEILSFAGKWMELENIILSEVSQAQKTKNHMFSFICRL